MTMFFGQGQTGWSETWWYPDGLTTGFYAKMQTHCVKRVNLLAPNHELLAVRVTREGGDRFTRLFLGGGQTTIDGGALTINLPGRGKEDGTGSRVEGPPDQVRAAIHLEVIRGGQRIGLRYLAGFPDKVSLTENPTLGKAVDSRWWDMFNEYRNDIVNEGWAIKLLDKGTGFPLTDVITYRIRNAAPSVLGVVIPFAATFASAAGGKAALQGVRMTRRGLESPNGTYYVDAVEADQQAGTRTIWLRGTEGFDPDTFLTLGKIRAVRYGYQRPTWLEPIRVGIHKRGKPFGSPVGRRPTR